MEFQVTSREFNRNSAKIREESLHKPVIITVRGEPTNVLLSYKEYVRVSNLQITARLQLSFCSQKSRLLRSRVRLVRNKELVKAPEFD